jgi:metal-responsive CopG/Arc/MetJ family transcriptional regulator
MGNRKTRKSYQSKPTRRVRIFLFLKDSEADELERAARESGACSRGLLITEAVKTGLSAPKLKLSQKRSHRKIGVWVPRRTAVELKQLAHEYNLTRTRLLRYLLVQYLANAPWRNNRERTTQEAAAP